MSTYKVTVLVDDERTANAIDAAISGLLAVTSTEVEEVGDADGWVDTYEDGAILKICVRYSATGPLYTFVALKVVFDVWYISGRDEARSWADVARLLDNSVAAYELVGA
jgi:hypothetical protein